MMKHEIFLQSLVLLIVATLPACSAFPSPQTSDLANSPAGLSTPSLSNLSTPTTSTSIEESQPLTTPTPAGESILFLPDCRIEPGSTSSAISPSQAYPGWDSYANAQYGFSFSIPYDWILVEASNYVCLFPQAAQDTILVVGFKKATENVPIQRSGVGAGDVVPRGTVRFLGQTLTRDVLVYDCKDKAVLYNNAMETQIDDLVFTLSIDDFRNDYDAAILPADIQQTADQIVESFELVNLAPAPSGEAPTNEPQLTTPSTPSASLTTSTPAEPTVSPSASPQTVFYYTTQSGDNLFSIAGRFDLHPETILWANTSLQDDPLNVEKPGVEIRIPAVDGYFYVWQMGDTLQDVVKTHGASFEVIVDRPGNELDPANPEASLTPGKEIFLPGGFPQLQNQ
jgi:LysM repeat protein